MKTRRIHIEKIIVLVICCSLIMQMVWNLTKPRVYAAEGDSDTGETELLNVGTGTIEINGTEVILDSESSLQKDFEITSSENGGYKITCAQPLTDDDAEREASNISKLTVNCMGNVNINTDLSADIFMDNEYSSVTIGSGYTFNCSSLSGTTGFWLGTVIINGTLKMSSYVSSDYGDYKIINNGTISADTIDISEIPYRQGYWDEEPHPRFSDGSSSKYYATDSFIKGDDDLEGIVQAGSKDTIIKSSGGSFKLMLELDGGGTITRTIEGTNINSSAGELLFAPADINIETGDLPGFTDDFPLYEGQFYNYLEGVYTNPEVYADDVQLWYAPAGSTAFSTTRPEEAGDYQVYALLPKAGDRVESKSDTYDFSIQNLPMDELYPSGNPDFTISGYVNGKYVPEALVLTLNDEDVTFCCPAISDSFSNSLTITEEELAENNLLVDGHLDSGTMLIKFRSEEEAMDNATTSAIPIGSVVNGIGNFIFDSEKPEIFDVYFTYGEAEVETSIENSGEIIADSLSFTVYDENLRQVVCDGKTYSEDLEEGACYITIDGETGVKKSITLTATDWADNEFSISFILFKPAEVTATITVADIYVGGTVKPVLTVNPSDYDGEIKYQYKLSTASNYSSTVPSAAGTYEVLVILEPTAKYSGTSCTYTFTISKNIVSAAVTVADIHVGETPDPQVTTISDGDITYEYKLSTAADTAYSTGVPTAAGEYTVRATVAETDNYTETIGTGTFKILKNKVTAQVSVADLYVGGTVNPVLTVDPEGYNGTPVYEYKSSTDDSYSSTVPTAAGEYTVRVTLPDTAAYEGTECTDTFTISKNIVSAAVTVADIYVGGTPNPSVTLNSEEYDGEYTAVYENAAGEKVTEFTSAGEYKVTVTIPDSDEYVTVTCENTFMVSRKEATASVTVADIHVGETPDPQVTTISDGDITYEYKLSTAEDTAYSTTVPTAAGEYTVRATIAESDTYEETECTGTFEILKNEVAAAVTVADIFVGGTPEPSVTLNSEEYDGDYTVVYENAAGEKVTEFTSAGEYKVIVTIPESEEYVAASCGNTFTVSRKEISATVSVSDIFVGGTVKPVLTVDPEDYDGTVKYEYKLSTEPDTSYSETVPDEAGKYTVRATLSATEIYEGTTCEASFSIRGKEPVEVTAEVSVEDIYAGGTPVPSVKTDPEDYDGTYIVTYENAAGEEVTEFTAAGEYKVIVTLPDSGLFIGTTCEDSFKVSRKNVTASVSVADILVGGTVEPVLTVDPEDYDGKVRYEYKGSADASYSSTVPTAAGTYKVRATLQETDVFEGTECEADFTISKGEVKATVTVADIYVGGTPAPSVKTDPADYDGTPVYEYKLSSDPDTAYSSAVPGTAGTYTVRATLPSTVNYLGTTCTDEFTISKNTVTATVSVADITVGNTPAPVVKTESDGKVIFEYKSSSAPDTAYSSAVPSKAGKYTVRATVEETNRYLSTTCTAEFTISLNKVTKMDLSVPDIFYGQTVSASFDTDSDGAVTIVYKSSGAADSTYSSTAPVKVGSYIAMATVDETDKFESDSCTVAFKISYLDAPATAYTLSGTQGKNGYYTSDVVLNAPQGFSVSASEGGTFSGSIPYSENLNTIYLKRADGALTAGIAISNKPKIDKAAPSISSSSGISNGAVLFESSVTLTVNDPNLASLKVNGSAVSLSSSGSTVLTLTRPESGFKTFSITAEDEAGNISTFEFTLMAEWLKDKKIPAGQTVSLNAGEVYYLDEGTWIVSIVNSDGTITEGTTVFSGNLPFYVGVTGDYIFTRVT